MAYNDRHPRAPTEQENASLLVNQDHDRPGSPRRKAFIAEVIETPLTRILFVSVLVLLILTSVFAGLFTGVQHKLELERGRKGGDGVTTTVIVTTTTLPTTTTSTIIQPTSVPSPLPSPPPTSAPCETPECILLSASIISSLDTSQDPCENFYDFANGGWIDDHPLPPYMSSYGRFEALSRKNHQVIQKILEKKGRLARSETSSPDERLMEKLTNLYTSCMDERALNEIGVAPLLKVVRSIHDRFSGTFRGHLSEESSSQDTLRGLTDALSYLHSIGIGGLFSFDVEGDVGVDPNFMTLWFNQPRFGLPSMEYYKERHVTTVYQDVIENLLSALTEQEVVPSRKASFLANSDAVLLYWPWKPPGKLPKSTKQLAQSVVEFETQLANASLNYDLDDILYHDPRAKYNPMPLTDLINAIPQVNLKDYLSAFLPRVIPPKVIVTHPAYLKALSGILNSTSASTVEAYLITRAALELSPYLGTETKAWKSQRRLLELLSGLKEGVADDRSQYCTTTVESALGFATGRYFVNQTFSEDSREQAMNVVTNIVEAFKSSLNNVGWMDNTSAQAAAEKASVIQTRVKVGYPLSPDTRDPSSLLQYYSHVNIFPTNFFANMLNASASVENKKWARLGEMRDMEAWEMMFPSTADAFFRAPANKIVLPAGILQPPFFSSHWPAYMYYGAFGFIAAHELTHAFDSAGRMYNQQGRLKEWWTNETSDGFQVKQDCVLKQYSAYTIDDGHGGQMHVNGNLTSGENIGDSGLIQSYRAWKAQYPDSFNGGNEKLLPGLNFTREQLFFVSFACMWSRTMNTATAIEHLRTDPHSPARYRVEGTVSNIPEFAKAFNCSTKAKLNPPREKQCIFWGSD